MRLDTARIAVLDLDTPADVDKTQRNGADNITPRLMQVLRAHGLVEDSIRASICGLSLVSLAPARWRLRCRLVSVLLA